MKIIFEDHVVEFTYKEFLKLITIKEKKQREHRSRLRKKDIKLITKIITENPKRSDGSIARELNKYTRSKRFSRESVRYWREKINIQESNT